MSKIEVVRWNQLKFKYSPNDNYHGTCYYGALKHLLGKDFEKIYKEEFVSELIANHSTRMNVINPFSKWVNKNKEYRFAEADESFHDEEGVLWVASDEASHIVYFKNGFYYDDYMSLTSLKDLLPVLIIVKNK